MSAAPSTGNGSGFTLGDAANYALIAFDPHNFQGTANSPIGGNVGVGPYSGIQLANDTITGDLVTTGAAPQTTGGTVTGTIRGGDAALATDISALTSLSTAFKAEAGANLGALSNGQTISASSGVVDAGGNEVFTVSKWADNLTISGGANDHVVLNVGDNSGFKLENLALSGGITANNVLINYTGSQELHGTNGDTFNGTVLTPNAKVNVNGISMNGHVFGGAAGQDFQWVSGANITTPPIPPTPPICPQPPSPPVCPPPSGGCSPSAYPGPNCALPVACNPCPTPSWHVSSHAHGTW
jgi:choice-of-anchor A domain-containing protein